MCSVVHRSLLVLVMLYIAAVSSHRLRAMTKTCTVACEPGTKVNLVTNGACDEPYDEPEWTGERTQSCHVAAFSCCCELEPPKLGPPRNYERGCYQKKKITSMRRPHVPVSQEPPIGLGAGFRRKGSASRGRSSLSTKMYASPDFQNSDADLPRQAKDGRDGIRIGKKSKSVEAKSEPEPVNVGMVDPSELGTVDTSGQPFDLSTLPRAEVYSQFKDIYQLSGDRWLLVFHDDVDKNGDAARKEHELLQRLRARHIPSVPSEVVKYVTEQGAPEREALLEKHLTGVFVDIFKSPLPQSLKVIHAALTGGQVSSDELVQVQPGSSPFDVTAARRLKNSLNYIHKFKHFIGDLQGIILSTPPYKGLFVVIDPNAVGPFGFGKEEEESELKNKLEAITQDLKRAIKQHSKIM